MDIWVFGGLRAVAIMNNTGYGIYMSSIAQVQGVL